MGWRGVLLSLGLALALGAGPAAAQRVEEAGPATGPAVPPSVLVLDTDRLFAETAFGQRVSEEVGARTDALIEENRRIEAQLTEEERSLTERRATMDPAAFREEAEAFDTRVQAIRQEQDAKERALQQSVSAERGAFLDAAGPTLGQLMLDRGASVILDRRSVFLSAAAADITDAAIEALDRSIGDGADLAGQRSDGDAPAQPQPQSQP
ncbi:OmpH family outer membrane protein [Pseudoroseicyclus aestuarii]|uniref:Periplasmic chaperone for outer membrane proteins Skp n=1 Tax=Pseudoroseicyclus aestuarii TaxID=1795041 RepID=A0A318SXQ9_9RHOB|nr:OmpH family outer membrane protein [Pseudoroseicyclus aestuarii]PYE86213.1 periplasmic chaperone for outer membrane proteins Skp [Pseudoroseicyclus aestuarii]